jgi:polar amino acid transport system substrate-binding protein
LRWNEQNIKDGLKPVEFQYYDDDVVLYLALESGRADAYLGPNALLGFKAARPARQRLAGNFSGGWPLLAEIAVTTRKGNGLAEAITQASTPRSRTATTPKRSRAGTSRPRRSRLSRTNPPGLPKS